MDEANSAIGVVLAVGEPAQEIVAVLGRVQNELFDVGADLHAVGAVKARNCA